MSLSDSSFHSKKRTIAYGFLILLLFTQINANSYGQNLRPKLAIQLLLNTKGGSENTADGVMAFYDDHFSKGIGNEDSYKFTNLDENLAINCNGTLLSIEGRPIIHGSDTMLLQMWTFRQKTYLLQLKGSNFSPDLTAILKDNYLKKETVIDLSSETLIPFGLTKDSASFALNRFSVIFKTKETPPVVKVKLASVNSNFTVFPNPVKGNVVSMKMSNMRQGRYLVSLYTMGGQIIYSAPLEYEGGSTKTLVIDRAIHKGLYRLQLSFRGLTTGKMVLFE